MDYNEDVFIGLLECADDSILELNGILNKKGYEFKGYDYDSFVEKRLDFFISGNKKQYAAEPNNSTFTIDGEKVKRNPLVLQLIRDLGITVDFDRTSWRNKIFF